MRFSIIIPVYNVEKYIAKCMDTVMGQTFDDYEVIVVNDETPDNSMAIVQHYVELYPGRIHVIHQKNTRQGGARNRGVLAARGEYILFVDSDDYVSTDMLETVNRKLEEHPADILVFRHTPVTEQGEPLPEEVYDTLPEGVYIPWENPEVVQLPTGPVNKAFRREFYLNTGVAFPEKLLYEDGVMRLVYAMASSVSVCDDVLYYYVQSSGSSMRGNVSERMLDILQITDLLIDGFRERDLYDAFREPLECALIYGILYVLNFVNRVQPDHPMQRKMADYIAEQFPDYGQNPYVSEELNRSLECLLKYDFRRYHYRFLLLNQAKERILNIPMLRTVNTWRKRLQSCFKR